MPKNKVRDHITDQEMAFARLVLSGTVTDRDAAHAAGLSPDSAAYTKAKPRVRAYMLQHRAAMQQQREAQQTEARRKSTLGREQVLVRLWQIANLGPEMTRGSINGQVKALAMIVAIEGLIPDRRPGASQQKPVPPPAYPEPYPAGRHDQQEETVDPQAETAPAQEKDEPGLVEAEPTPPPPDLPLQPGESANDLSAASTMPFETRPPDFVPDTRVPLHVRMRPYGSYR